jgi:multidrug efflux system outer membrane protein
MRTITCLTAACLIALVVAGCTVGPNYKRPVTEIPNSFRGQMPESSGTSGTLADEQWSRVFQDDALLGLIRAALGHNDDIRIAAARILEAQAQLGIRRADQFPEVTVGLQVLGERPSSALGFPAENIGAVELQGSVSWEVDFWGKFRRGNEAARAQLLASEWGRRAVATTLVSQVASAYYSLRTLDLELDISKRTLVSRQESLRLTQVRESGGVT